jgi:hypothetical protein
MDHLPLSIKCPNCASALREDDYDQEKGLMKCGYCRTLLLQPKARSGPQGFCLLPPIPLPAGMTLENTTDGIIITRSWRKLLAGFVLFMGILMMSSIIFGSINRSRDQNIFSMFVLIGVLALVYYELAMLINKTRVLISHGSINVSHGPLPWFGWREIASGMVEQVYCKEIITRGKDGPMISCETWVILSDGSNTKLVGGGLEVDQALYIEQQIESLLDVKDRPIAGEYRR